MSDSTGLPLLGASKGAECPETATHCSNLTELYCYNNGVCCMRDSGEEFCACPNRFEGGDCSEDVLMSLLESRDETITMMGWSSAISIFVGLIALVALGIIIFIVIRSSGKWRFWAMGSANTEKDLDETIIFVQEEISKLPTVQQLTKLHRLSRLIREAILSESEDQVEPPKGEAMNEYLPRWSSAPICINHTSNDLDRMGERGGDNVFPAVEDLDRTVADFMPYEVTDSNNTVEDAGIYENDEILFRNFPPRHIPPPSSIYSALTRHDEAKPPDIYTRLVFKK